MSNHEAVADVLIVGGSLAGLMAGIALARRGHEVTLLERADRIRPSGASLIVRETDLATILGPEHARAAARMAGAANATAPPSSVRITTVCGWALPMVVDSLDRR